MEGISHLARCVVKSSPIDGRGLFAVRRLPARLHLGPCMVRRAMFASLPEILRLALPFEFKFAHTANGCYINHSVSPNVELSVGGAPDLSGAHTVDIRTLVEIDAGCELTADYAVLERLSTAQSFVVPLRWWEAGWVAGLRKDRPR